MAVKLGTEVTDNVSGVKGIAVSRSYFLHGCVRVGIQPKSTDGTKREDRYYADENDLTPNDGVHTPNPAVLGNKVTDSITGFTGVAVCYSEYMHSTPRVAIQPKALHEGKPVEQQDFDFPQLKEYDKYVTPKVKERPGGPGDRAPRMGHATR